MTSHKLKLKRTPEEEEQRRLRKERKKERKRKHDDQDPRAGASSKKARGQQSSSRMKWASSDEDDIEIGPQPAGASGSAWNIPPSQSYAHKPDYDALKAEIEQQRFREKMFDAMGEDERLDSVEARFNDYAQVPDRWRMDGGKSRQNVFEDDFVKQDPALMDDEEYAEWIRLGMYRFVPQLDFAICTIDMICACRKTHAEEYAEQQRRKAAKEARRAEEKQRKAETARMEKVAEEECKQRKLESASRRLNWAREQYNTRWEILLSGASDAAIAVGDAQVTGSITMLSFDDIPWPIATAHHRDKFERHHHSKGKPTEGLDDTRKSISAAEMTADAIASFLLPVAAAISDAERALKKKERKDKLRETFLRFHPDKFEGRFMKRIKEEEREKVREAIGQVSRALNALMGDGD